MLISRLDQNGKLTYGQGLANNLAYMMSGFRGWELFGLIRDEADIGVEVDHQGATTNSVMMCAVYGKRDVRTIESDEVTREHDQIEEGLTAIVLFRGIDNSSHMRRMRPEEYDRIVLTEFVRKDSDLFYNS